MVTSGFKLSRASRGVKPGQVNFCRSFWDKSAVKLAWSTYPDGKHGDRAAIDSLHRETDLFLFPAQA